MASKREGYVVSHTHWDRAWYWTFEQTRARLVFMMDDLLELMRRDAGFKHFVLDGQAAMVEDYLEVRPERADELCELARAGRLLLGPMFVLPDLFIPAGESLVRNLMLGHRLAASRGPVMKLGYLPDPFGYPGQLPQVLAGFDIHGVLISRGMGDEGERLGADFYWEGPDGTRVLATHQVGGGYCNLAGFGEAPGGLPGAVEQLEGVLSQMAPYCPHGLFLLNNGCDHQHAQPELPELLGAAARQIGGLRLRHSTPVAYQRAVRRAIAQGSYKPGIHRGELRGGRYANLLSGVLSARVDLKLLLHSCEVALLNWAEPWTCLAQGLGMERDTASLLDRAWRLLLTCQPHDNICGCSIDAVHEDDLNAMARSRQIADLVAERAMQAIADQIRPPCPRGPMRVAFNPHPWPLRQVVFCGGARGTATGPDGPLPTQPVTGGSLVELELPPLGYRAFGAGAPSKPRPAATGDVLIRRTARQVSLDNGLVAVRLHDTGRLSLKHRETGLALPSVALLADDGDAGDTYDHAPPPRQSTVTETAGVASLRIKERGPLRATAELRYALNVPAGLTRDRRGRSLRRRRLPVNLLLSLTRGSPVVELTLTVHNRVDGHRLRFCVELPFVSEEVLAGAPFQVVARGVRPLHRPHWQQRPSATHPFSGFIAGESEASGVALLAPGLHEYEAQHRRGKTRLMVTLLRSVRWLSRADLSTRSGHAGPALPLQGARQLGATTFRLALVPYVGSWQGAAVARRAMEHAAPIQVLTSRQGKGDRTAEGSFLSLAPASVVLTSLTRGPRGTLLARIVNLDHHPVLARLQGPRAAHPVALDGRPLGGALNLERIAMKPGEIITLRLQVDY